MRRAESNSGITLGVQRGDIHTRMKSKPTFLLMVVATLPGSISTGSLAVAAVPTWSEPITLDGRGSSGAVAIGPTGESLVAWQRPAAVGDPLGAILLQSIGSASDPVVLSTAGATTPAVAIGPAGIAVAAWIQVGTNGLVGVWAATRDRNGVWSPSTLIGGLGGDPSLFAPSASIRASVGYGGEIAVVWVARPQSFAPSPLVAAMYRATSGWVPPTELSVDAGASPVVTGIPTGGFGVAWLGSTRAPASGVVSSNVLVRRWTPIDGWRDEENPGMTGSGEPSLVVNDDGTAVVGAPFGSPSPTAIRRGGSGWTPLPLLPLQASTLQFAGGGDGLISAVATSYQRTGLATKPLVATVFDLTEGGAWFPFQTFEAVRFSGDVPSLSTVARNRSGDALVVTHSCSVHEFGIQGVLATVRTADQAAPPVPVELDAANIGSGDCWALPRAVLSDTGDAVVLIPRNSGVVVRLLAPNGPRNPKAIVFPAAAAVPASPAIGAPLLPLRVSTPRVRRLGSTVAVTFDVTRSSRFVLGVERRTRRHGWVRTRHVGLFASGPGSVTKVVRGVPRGGRLVLTGGGLRIVLRAP